ncbi:MAG: acetyltransferase [Tepidisphaerales bacterium]
MDVLIVGAGGHGRVVLEVLQASRQHRVVGFLDADESLTGQTVLGVPVLGHPQRLLRLRGKARGAVVAVGDNRARVSYAHHLASSGLELVSAVHPSAVVSPSATLGRNVVVCAGAVVGTEARLDDSVLVNTGALVDHECEVGEGAHIAPGAALAGRVRVGPGAFVGLGARVIQCLSVGAHAVVGAGAVVIRDVPPDATVVGVPARPIRLAASGPDR